MQAGDLQLWSLESNVLLDSIPCADPALSCAAIPNSPYICLGCQSGMLQFLQVNSSSGEPAEGVVEAHSLELLPYECQSFYRCHNLLARQLMSLLKSDIPAREARSLFLH